MSRAGKLLVAAGVLLGLGVSGLVCARVAERGRYAVPYSTLGSGPSGTRALYLLAKDLGAEPVRIAEDLSRLPAGGMLVVLGGCEVWGQRPSRYEVKAVRRWVDRGGVLLVAGSRHFLTEDMGLGVRLVGGCPADPFLRRLEHAFSQARLGRKGRDAGAKGDAGSHHASHASDDDDAGPIDHPVTKYALPESPALEGLDMVPFDNPARIELDDDTHPVVLMSSYDQVSGDESDGGVIDGGVDGGASTAAAAGPDGGVVGGVTSAAAGDAGSGALLSCPPAGAGPRPVAVAFRRGKGRVIVLASASPFRNDALDASEGGVLFHRLRHAYAPHARAMFDEYHLGVGSQRSLMRYVEEVGGGPAVAQVVLVVLILLWWAGVRFGSPRAPAAPAPGGTASYVGAIGQLYRRSKDASGAARIVVRRALGRIARHHHLPPADAEGLAKALDERARTGEARAVREIAAIERSSSAERNLVATLRAIDRATDRATTDPEGDS